MDNPVIAPGTKVGEYIVTRWLGTGTFADVMLAESSRTARKVAIKVLRPPNAMIQDFLERFQSEAKCAEILKDCEHIVRVFQVTQVGECPVMLMDYIDGSDLSSVIQSVEGQGLPAPLALSHAHDIAYALRFAHSRGICHRDVKPSNCLVESASQRVFLTDFGIASVRLKGKRSTRIGTIMGTPAYMAPELIMGGAVAATPASDVYSVGVLLYEMLTGTLPFDGPDDHEFFRQVLHNPAPRPSSRVGELPSGIDDLVARCLAKEPSSRPSDGAALFDAIDEVRVRLGYLESTRENSGFLVNLCDLARPSSRHIPPRGLTIGAGVENDVVVRDPRVSQRHAELVPQNSGRFLIIDHSTNGTSIRGRFLHNESAELVDGDFFFLGRRRQLRFVVVKA